MATYNALIPSLPANGIFHLQPRLPTIVRALPQIALPCQGALIFRYNGMQLEPLQVFDTTLSFWLRSVSYGTTSVEET